MFVCRRRAAASFAAKTAQVFTVAEQTTCEDFQSDPTAQRLVDRFEHDSHATATNLANNRVVVELFNVRVVRTRGTGRNQRILLQAFDQLDGLE